ncbi:MAG: lysostaphin resistance A-like protein [Planctomycetota bacterium]
MSGADLDAAELSGQAVPGDEPRAQSARTEADAIETSPLYLPGPKQSAAEIVLFWLGAPIAIALYRVAYPDARAPIIPMLLLGAIGGALLLWRDKTFDLGAFFDRKPLVRALREILPRFVVLGTAMVGLLALIHGFGDDAEARLFRFPLERPGFWLMVMVAYPIVSVFAQGVIYRGVLLHRYRGVLGQGRAMLLAGAAIFALAHVVMLNPVAVAITLVGGLLFVSTQLKHRSLLASGLEHALYGCWAFTVGYGQFLYAGSRRVAETAGAGG